MFCSTILIEPDCTAEITQYGDVEIHVCCVLHVYSLVILTICSIDLHRGNISVAFCHTECSTTVRKLE